MGNEKAVLDPVLSQLNAAHYKTLLLESKCALKQRELIDLQREYQAAAEARNALVKSTAEALEVAAIKSWDTNTGVVEYEPLPTPLSPNADGKCFAPPDTN